MQQNCFWDIHKDCFITLIKTWFFDFGFYPELPDPIRVYLSWFELSGFEESNI